MYYDIFETGSIGPLTLAADEMGLRHIEFATSRRPLHIPAEWKSDPLYFKEIKVQLKEYFKGERRQFDLPLAPRGTDFQLAVWQVLHTIPYGQVASYRWVAEQIGNPRAVRAVGGANARNPLPIVVPCHRVIGSDGALTGFGGGMAVKQRLLDLEKSASAHAA
jgi:methylated-DNA-[protein]-cysteine S-methyltransferase